MSEPIWDQAMPATPADARASRRRPEIVSLRPTRVALPDLQTLFTFMRDAELRFRSLRLRIEERTLTASGPQTAEIDAAIRHPGRARVTTTRSGSGAVARYDTWLSDAETVWTYTGSSRVATRRPARRAPAGLDLPGLPGKSRVYPPLTPLPRESLPDAFVHPAGFCQNVLATGRTWVAGTTAVAGREGIVVECDHPRSVLVSADRPDHHVQVVADVETGVILRLVESIGGETTRDAEVVSLEVDAPLSDAIFALSAPPDARRIY